MKEERDYIQDITEIRSMMERSSKFLSLSGLAGVMAGIYALAGAWTAYHFLEFNPNEIIYGSLWPGSVSKLILLGIVVLVLAVGTAIVFSRRKAQKTGEQVWNTTSRRLLVSMAVPLLAGGAFVLILIAKGLIGLAAPVTLLFYGLAIYNSSKFTYSEMKFMGLFQITLGLIGTWFIGYGLLLWALGFGVVHIVYGLYMHFSYER